MQIERVTGEDGTKEFRLILFDVDEETGSHFIKDIMQGDARWVLDCLRSEMDPDNELRIAKRYPKKGRTEVGV